MRFSAIFFLFIQFLIFRGLQAQDRIEVYFTQPVQPVYQQPWRITTGGGGDIVRDRIIRLISEATYTLDVCVYNNNSLDITAALIHAQERGVRVRYITDNSTSNSALSRNLPFKVLYLNPENGIMHNKFILKDALLPGKAEMMTGSTNLTNSGLDADANNVLFIRNAQLTNAYLQEFEEMWDSNNSLPGPAPKCGRQKQDNTAHQFIVAGINIELYFAPTDGTQAAIAAAMASADNSFRLGMYTLTNFNMTDQLIITGLRVDDFLAIVDNIETSRRSLSDLQAAGLNAIEHTPDELLHHKYAIIDAGLVATDPQVITGSFNWTYSAENYNDENTLIIHDAEIATLYQAEFYSRYCELQMAACAGLYTQSVIPAEVSRSVLVGNNLLLSEIYGSLEKLNFVSVYEQTGKPVLHIKDSGDGLNDQELDLSGMVPGTYYLVAGFRAHRSTIRLVKL